MTLAEYALWFEDFRAAFPSVHAWLAKFPDQPTGDQPSRDQVLAAWAKIMRDVRQDHAHTALALLARGDEEPPRSFDDYPRFVRRLAKKLRKQSAAAGPNRWERLDAPRCAACGDSGLVSCYTTDFVRAVEAHDRHGDPLSAATCCGLRCTCDAGSRVAPTLPLYSPANWRAFGAADRELAAGCVREWFAARATIARQPQEVF